MILKTKFVGDFGKTVNFGGKEYTFDRLGCLDVKDPKEAKELLMSYQGHLVTEEQEKEVKDKQGLYKEKNVEAVVDKLQAEISKLEETVEERDATIKAMTVELTDWKDAIEELKQKKDKAEKDLKDYTTVKGNEIEDLKLQLVLTNKTVKELIDVCLEYSIDEEKFKTLTKKEDLINLILSESRK